MHGFVDVMGKILAWVVWVAWVDKILVWAEILAWAKETVLVEILV